MTETDTIKTEKLEPITVLTPVIRYETNSPNQILFTESSDVTENEFGSDEFRDLIGLLKNYVYFYNAAGISAIQVGIPKKVFIGRDEKRLEIFINPVILETSTAHTVEYEGCLSFPEIFVPVQRAKTVLVKYQNISGEFVESEYEDLLARVILHESEHLQGKTFLDNVSHLKRILVLEKIAKLKKTGQWNRFGPRS